MDSLDRCRRGRTILGPSAAETRNGPQNDRPLSIRRRRIIAQPEPHHRLCFFQDRICCLGEPCSTPRRSQAQLMGVDRAETTPSRPLSARTVGRGRAESIPRETSGWYAHRVSARAGPGKTGSRDCLIHRRTLRGTDASRGFQLELQLRDCGKRPGETGSRHPFDFRSGLLSNRAVVSPRGRRGLQVCYDSPARSARQSATNAPVPPAASDSEMTLGRNGKVASEQESDLNAVLPPMVLLS